MKGNYIIYPKKQRIEFQSDDKSIFENKNFLLLKSIAENNFDKVKDMMPDKTIEDLKHEIANDNLIYNVRDEEAILNTVNHKTKVSVYYILH